MADITSSFLGIKSPNPYWLASAPPTDKKYNVIRALEYANSIGCKTIALTGRDGGKLGPLAQLNIQVAAPHMGRIEDAHMIVCHMIGYYFMDGESTT